jgi:hypothetical protein
MINFTVCLFVYFNSRIYSSSVSSETLLSSVETFNFFFLQIFCIEIVLWSIVLLEMLIVTQLVKKCPNFIELRCSLLCSQEPTIGP